MINTQNLVWADLQSVKNVPAKALNWLADEHSLEIVIYCICLHIYSATTGNTPPPYQHPPSSLIHHVTSIVESRDSREWRDDLKQWVDLLAKYRQLLADCSQAEVLHKLGLGTYMES